MTAREPSEAMRLRARNTLPCTCGGRDKEGIGRDNVHWSPCAASYREKFARALAEQDTAARLAALELAAKWHDMRASHYRRQEERGHDLMARGYNAGGDASGYRRMAEYHETSAAAIRALSVTPPEAASEKENECG